ncbi:hypothetical protein TELCIR_02562 [Teladorsagia circumcincta]|uniref:MOSC domain-containing protein n=1 Tax=Teladorsagia circumcincta TaxID=45464 RepID=A0A2G9UYS7_TELCI|nr:hypothetical protein TELCIR_02562 [Teladorsagia circumcincta]
MDDVPYMINTQASLDDLNEKLDDKVTIEQFRPVIVVDKGDASDEDRESEAEFKADEWECEGHRKHEETIRYQ